MKRGIYDFIVEQPKAFNDKITTESGFELTANTNFSGKQLANNICKVVNTPATLESEILPGFEVLVDTDIYFSVNTELGGERPNPNLIDKEKGWYKINPNSIILYRENSNCDWKGFQDNVIIEFMKEEPKKHSFLDIPNQQTVTSDTIATVIYSNTELEEKQEVHAGDKVALLHNYSVPINFNAKEYFWCKNLEIGAKIEEKLRGITISWHQTTPESYDGEKIKDLLRDEAGQWPNPNDSRKNWK